MARFAPAETPELVDPVDLVEALGASVAGRYAAIELRMIEVVADAIRKGLVLDLTNRERLTVIDRLRRYGQQLADVAMPPEVAADIIGTAVAEGSNAVAARLNLAGIPTTAGTAFTTQAQASIAALAVDLTNRLAVMEQRIARFMPDAYRAAVADEAAGVLAGVTDARLAQRRAAEKLLSQGIDGFTDAAGRRWRVGSYAEMATRTAVHRAYMDGGIDTMERLADLHLVQIIPRASACKECNAHRGRIYSTDGTPAGSYLMQHATEDNTVTVFVHGTLDQARANGWDHPNCTCVATPYLAGLRTPGTREPWSEQRMKDRDRLRTLERRMRDLRRRKAAAMTPAERRAVTARIKELDGQIAEHVSSTNEVRKKYRESASFADGRGPKATLPAIPRGL